jgi:hypothetical protein
MKPNRLNMGAIYDDRATGEIHCRGGAFRVDVLCRERLACSCGGGGSPCDDFGSSSAVFVGTAISVRTVERPADDQGYFTIEGYVGQTFVIEVRSNRPYSGDRSRFAPMEKVEPARVLLSKPSEFVNIVITKLR